MGRGRGAWGTESDANDSTLDSAFNDVEWRCVQMVPEGRRLDKDVDLFEAHNQNGKNVCEDCVNDLLYEAEFGVTWHYFRTGFPLSKNLLANKLEFDLPQRVADVPGEGWSDPNERLRSLREEQAILEAAGTPRVWEPRRELHLSFRKDFRDASFALLLVLQRAEIPAGICTEIIRFLSQHYDDVFTFFPGQECRALTPCGRCEMARRFLLLCRCGKQFCSHACLEAHPHDEATLELSQEVVDAADRSDGDDEAAANGKPQKRTRLSNQ
jgi:hypothetical protein